MCAQCRCRPLRGVALSGLVVLLSLCLQRVVVQLRSQGRLAKAETVVEGIELVKQHRDRGLHRFHLRLNALVLGFVSLALSLGELVVLRD